MCSRHWCLTLVMPQSGTSTRSVPMYPITPDYLRTRVEERRREAEAHRGIALAEAVSGESRRLRHASRRAGISGKAAPSES